MMFEDEYVDVDSEIKVRRPAPSDDAPPWMRPVPVCKVDNAESHALSSTTMAQLLKHPQSESAHNLKIK